eukprot:g52405.t1
MELNRKENPKVFHSIFPTSCSGQMLSRQVVRSVSRYSTIPCTSMVSRTISTEKDTHTSIGYVCDDETLADKLRSVQKRWHHVLNGKDLSDLEEPQRRALAELWHQWVEVAGETTALLAGKAPLEAEGFELAIEHEAR